MRLHTSALAVVLSIFAAGLPQLGAQSLGEAARQEEERRKSIKTEAKVYTNKDLPNVPPAAAPKPKAAADVPAAAIGDAKAEAGEARPDTTADASKRDQAYWSGRMRDLRTALDRNQTYLDALQSRINGLTADFVNRDDPAQRAVIARDRTRALAELERLTLQIEDDRKAIVNFEEEARRAGVPPGWLR
jgi:hypothetical protein